MKLTQRLFRVPIEGIVNRSPLGEGKAVVFWTSLLKYIVQLSNALVTGIVYPIKQKKPLRT